MKETNKLPLISVIVPIYNVETYLTNCINSILDSTYTNLEVILVDDGSTDNSNKICDEFQTKDLRCKVIHQTNSGLSAARNTGLKEATGEYISFIDGDDFISPIMYETLYQAIIKDDYSFSMIYGKLVYEQALQKKTLTANHTDEFQTIYQHELFQNLYGRGNNELQYQVVWNKLYKANIIKNLFFKKTGTEDTEYNNRIYLRTSKAVIVKEELYFYVQRPTSIIHQPINDNFIDRMNSYYLCFEQIPTNMPKYQAFCLEKMYKTIINVRYHARHTHYKASTNILCKRLTDQTFSSLLKNKGLEFHRKLSLLLFYYIPSSYTLFIKIMELSISLRNKK